MRTSILHTGVRKLQARKLAFYTNCPDPGRPTLRALSCVFGFLLPMRRLRERMASFEGTVFERMRSEISRLRAISSLVEVSILAICLAGLRRRTMSLTSPGQSARRSGRWTRTSLPSCRNVRDGCAARGVVLVEGILSLGVCVLFGWVVVVL
jgi:hypothetical protein